LQPSRFRRTLLRLSHYSGLVAFTKSKNAEEFFSSLRSDDLRNFRFKTREDLRYLLRRCWVNHLRQHEAGGGDE